MHSSKPVKLRNLINDEQTVDSLHTRYKNNNKSHHCDETRCLGSLINAKPVEHRVRSPSETLEHAKDFINNYYASIKRLDSPAHKNRLKEIEEQLRTTDTYYLKETELIYGAKLAWRNASRCIGRIQWSKLQVFDARFSKNANEMYEALCNHIKYATNKGSLRSAITILPQRVKSVNNDWRIWNNQLISYAGYRDKNTGKVVGDPINADFTDICLKLGWKGKGTRFDILPLVLSANGGPPQLFPLPEDLSLRVKIKHPKYKWFEELGLEWYALPAVSNMMLDVGGLQFTAAPFSGWYMVTEIGTRDLGDVHRYNMLEEIAQRMGLNTTSNSSLWRDQAVVELNIAVLDSFQSAGVTIVDHHTASETFMTHLANEQRLRGGCPADWVWLVPPTAGSTTQVFHQEMVNYHLLPNYEYLEPPWKNYDWSVWEKLIEQERKLGDKNSSSPTSIVLRKMTEMEKSPLKLALSASSSPRKSIELSPSSTTSNGDLTPRRLRFKEIARAVKFTSKLFGKALSRRIKATILYATETGKSERFANKLAQTFSCAFNVHLMSMSDYDMTCLEHEALLLIVTSTFGNGDPPENGEAFAKHLAAVKLTGDTSPDIDSINSVSTNPFFQMLSEDHKDGQNNNNNNNYSTSLDQNEKINGGIHITGVMGNSNGDNGSGNNNNDSENDSAAIKRQMQYKQIQEQQTNIRPLSNVRFSVFALGSTAYPHFCAFGRYVDQTLGELGAERILKCACGDELAGQERAFNEWSNQVFKIACDVFCLTDTIGPIEGRQEIVWSPRDVRFAPIEIIDHQRVQNNNNLINNTSTDGKSIISIKNISNNDLSTTTINNYNNNNSIIQKLSLKSSSEILSSKKTVVQNLMSITGKKIVPFTVKARSDLHNFVPEENLQTLNLELESDLVAGPDDLIAKQTATQLATNYSNNTNINDHNFIHVVSKPPPILFEPGDHVGIYPVNNQAMVEKILQRMHNDLKNHHERENRPAFDFDQVYRILVKRENMDLTPAASSPLSQNGNCGEDNWIPYDRLPITSIREALTRYLDITNPPNQEFLSILACLTNDLDEKKRLQQMARNFNTYEVWKNKNVPTLLSVLEEFKAIRFEPALITQIPLIKPRFYSVSGTSVSLTLGVVRFKTASGELREGLCSNYLNTIPISPKSYVYGYIRSAPAFHMPQDKSVPMILISAGTGIAPFRSFWQKRYADMYKNTVTTTINGTQEKTKELKTLSFGRIDMYFGCRNSNYILYKDELDQMYETGVLSSINIAFSRPIDRDVWDADGGANSGSVEHHQLALSQAGPKTGKCSKVDSIRQARKRMYVQDKLLENSREIFKLIMLDGAHVYVCGDVAMADGVYKTLAKILNESSMSSKPPNKSGSPSLSTITETVSKDNGGGSSSNGTIADLPRTSEDGETVLMNLRNLNRYHEDIFGAKQIS